MITRFLLFLVIFVVVMPASADTAPQALITDAKIEQTDNAQQVRIIFDSQPNNLAIKKICTPDMIRVRIKGLGARNEKIESLPISEKGPFDYIRIITRNRNTTTVQLISAYDNLAECERTSVSYESGEITISTDFTEKFKKRVAQQKEREQLIAAMKAQKALDAAMIEKNKSNVSEVKEKPTEQLAETENLQENVLSTSKPSTSPSSEKPLFSSSKTKSESPVSNAAVQADPMRMAAGFIFAAVVALFAYVMLKKKDRQTGHGNSIEITATKRIGTNQQLVLASAQGTQFLLAVNDKGISMLSQITPEKPFSIQTNTAANILDLSVKEKSFPKETAATNAMIPSVPSIPISDDISSEMYDMNIEFSDDDERPEVSPYKQIQETISVKKSVEPILSSEEEADNWRNGGFERHLREAMLLKQSSRTKKETGNDIPSNAAGLIALARARSAFGNASEKIEA